MRSILVGAKEFPNRGKLESRRVGKSEYLKRRGIVMSASGAQSRPRPRISVRARVRAKAQLTLPEEIRRALCVGEGDDVEFAVQEDGTIMVRGYVSVPAEQARLLTAEAADV